MAVASEPYIFWKGDHCLEIMDKITIPKEFGTLEPALSLYNGPSGNTLDDKFLKPLGMTRNEAWLCALVPYWRINPRQRNTLKRHYDPEVNRYGLPACTIPNFTKTELKNQANRHLEILQEITESQCDTIILLGDLPVKYWLSHFSKFKKLSDFGETPETYGKLHDVIIEGQHFDILRGIPGTLYLIVGAVDNK